MEDPGVALFQAISAVALFTFLAVSVFARSRQVERTEYYKAEMMKKIAEVGGTSSPALDYLREQEQIKATRRLGGMKLGGLINIGAGFGLMILLHGLVRNEPVYLVGTIPMFVGLALLAYGYWIAPERAT